MGGHQLRLVRQGRVDEADAGPRRQEDGRARDIVNLAEPSQWIVLERRCVERGVFVQRLREIGAHDAGRKTIDAHILGAPLDRQVARQLRIGGLRHRISAEVTRPLEAGDAREQNHRTAAARGHAGDHHVGEPERRTHVGTHDLVERFVRDRGERSEVRIDGRVGDQHVDLPILRERGVDQRLQLLFEPDVARE